MYLDFWFTHEFRSMNGVALGTLMQRLVVPKLVLMRRRDYHGKRTVQWKKMFTTLGLLALVDVAACPVDRMKLPNGIVLCELNASAAPVSSNRNSRLRCVGPG